jgi:hypothetical protein
MTVGARHGTHNILWPNGDYPTISGKMPQASATLNSAFSTGRFGFCHFPDRNTNPAVHGIVDERGKVRAWPLIDRAKRET